MNVNNCPKQGDFLIVPSLTFSCSYFSSVKDFDPIEFDPNKDKKNQERNSISLARTIDILNDLKKFQLVTDKDKWEDFSKIDFDKEEIPKNTGNLDPIRGLVFGHIDGKLHVFAYTFRHEIGDMKYRVISLRRASDKEREMYEAIQNSNDGAE
jgi:uncharacterized DUF497 family protein